MKRRDFVSLVSAAMGTSFIASCKKDLINTEAASHMDIMAARGNGGGGGGAATRYALKIPATVSPSNLSLSSAPAQSNLGGGLISNVWAYNGQFPASTIIANRGDTATINLHNGLNEETITHWHGLIVNHANDGQPMQTINHGGNYSYQFTINQRAGLNFYHPHPHMLTGKQVYMGLAGGFIIRDIEELALNLPSGKYEVPLILRDASLDKNNNLNYKPAAGGMFGKIPMVNGTRSPYLEVEKAVYRFRILNGANSRIFALALSDSNNPMRLIGNDGGLLASHADLNMIDMSNGERTDVLINFSNYNPGTKIMLRDLRSGWDLLEFRVITATGGIKTLPSTSSSIVSLPSPVRSRTFSFDAMSKINGLEYNMDRIDWTVPFNETEEWIFKTNGNAPHPVHVHGASFQVIERTGGRNQVYPWEGGWKDTVLLEDGETVKVKIRFDAFRGIYLLHCHKLEHEDMGMMANFDVV